MTTTLSPDPSVFDEDHFPARAGDWVASGDAFVRIAQIKKIYRDGEFLVDLVIFDNQGNRIGRESPQGDPIELPDGRVYRGPRTFEPAVPLANWYRIAEPDFPVKMIWVAEGGFRKPRHNVERKGWGDYKRRVRTPLLVQGVKATNFDPELERRARRYAAEMLRDAAHETGIQALVERAERLERELDELGSKAVKKND